MRIVQIEPMIVEIPLREPVTGVHGVTSVQSSVLVRVVGDDGVEGWGDVDPTPGYTLESVDDIHAHAARLATTLHGADPFNLHRALALMDEAGPSIRALEGDALTLVEQPVRRDRIDALAEIRRKIRIPLMADESVTSAASLIEIIKREAADIVKVKAMKQGGLLRTRSMVD